MTFDEVLANRNEARKKRHEVKDEFCDLFEKASESMSFEKLQNTEYQWGYWDGIVAAMNLLKIKEIPV